jgi:hypothetical protein
VSNHECNTGVEPGRTCIAPVSPTRSKNWFTRMGRKSTIIVGLLCGARGNTWTLHDVGWPKCNYANKVYVNNATGGGLFFE